MATVLDPGPLGAHPEDVTTIDATAFFLWRLQTLHGVVLPPYEMRHAEPGYVKVVALIW